MGHTVSFESTVHEILVQLFIAFGQGAGTMRVSRETIAAATRDYVDRIEQHVDRWESIQVQTLDVARSLGRLSAHLALLDAGDVILPKHYEGASRHSERMAPCPFCFVRAPGSEPSNY